MKTIHYFLDTETSGLKAKTHALLEVCIVKRVNGVEENRIHFRVHPFEQDQIDQAALNVNGLNPSSWGKDDALTPFEAAQTINGFFEIPRRGEGAAYVVGHNVGFDVRFLYALAEKTGQRISIPYNQIDTKHLASVLLPFGLPNRKMDTIRDFLGMSSEGAHTALQDVRDVMWLYDLLVPKKTGGNLFIDLCGWMGRFSSALGGER